MKYSLYRYLMFFDDQKRISCSAIPMRYHRASSLNKILQSHQNTVTNSLFNNKGKKH